MKKKFIFLNTQNIDFTQTQGHDYRLVKKFYSFFLWKTLLHFFNDYENVKYINLKTLMCATHCRHVNKYE